MKAIKKIAPKPVKELISKLGLRKPLLRIASAEFREIDRATKFALSEINAPEFERIKQKHANSSDGYIKYLDLEAALEPGIEPCVRLGLLKGPPKRILDIGCGPAYFLFLARRHGHDVVGIDIEDTEIFNDLVGLFRIPRVTHRVEAFKPLPDAIGKPFDLITAIAICFDLHRTDNIWGVAQWKFFLEDCKKHLNPGGRIFLHFNPATTRDFDFIPDEVAAFLRSLPGGDLSECKEYFVYSNPA